MGGYVVYFKVYKHAFEGGATNTQKDVSLEPHGRAF